MEWEEVITISEAIFEETKREAPQLRAIMDKQVIKSSKKVINISLDTRLIELEELRSVLIPTPFKE